MSGMRVFAVAAGLVICCTVVVRADLPGDLTGDCTVTMDDVAPFVSVLIGTETDVAMIQASDVDGNGVADARDIAGFVSQLTDMATCPSCVTQASGFAGGTGVPGDPYQICNATQLQLAGSYLDADFILTSDIDLTGVSFTPIGITLFADTVIHYNGTFNGAGHRVRNLTVQQPSTDVIGLFGKLGPNAIVFDLGVENVNVRGNLCVGGFAAENNGIVRRCYVTGQVTGATYVGGLVGDNRSVTLDCYADVTVTGTADVGGFAGVTFASPTYVHCYSIGSVTGASNVGGFIGGMIGPHTVTSCYWDTQTSGVATSNGGTGKTTAEMQQQSTYAGWSFPTPWTITTSDYPHLVWE